MWFKLFFNSVWSWLKPVIMLIVASTSQDLLNSVLLIVTELAQADMADDAKREAAFERVATIFASQGKTVKASMINLLIEIAVQKLKEQQQ